MRKWLWVFLVCFFGKGFAQKELTKSLHLFKKVGIEINAEHCFKVMVNVHSSNQLVVTAAVEGEYQQDLLLSVNEESGRVFIDANFSPFFKNPNDKLSAHKVVSISLKILVPKDLIVQLYGSYTNASFKGDYKRLFVTLNDGDCRLDNFAGEAIVKTLSGNIYLNAKEGMVNAVTRHGKLIQEEMPVEGKEIDLQSISGDIFINRSFH